MDVEINDVGFKQAEALLLDSIFLLKFDGNYKDWKLYKLLKARQENHEFEMNLAEFICGEANNCFPYRSSYYLTKFFNDLGFEYVHDGTTRRFWVNDVLLQMTVKELSFIIENGLFNKRDFRKEAHDKNQDLEENFQKAITEFKNLIKDSLSINDSIDLSYLLDSNNNIELLFDKRDPTSDDELNKLIDEAKDRFFKPNDKQIAIEKLWDAFERIKTYFEGNKKQSSEKLLSVISNEFNYELFNSEFQILTKIGNEFRIRHHETDKKEIIETKHLNYLFFRMLSLINLCLISINENKS